MSVPISAAVWRDGPTQPAERMMLLALADHASAAGLCWPGLALLAEKCCVTERTARRTIRRLEQEGWIKVSVGGGRLSSRYQIDLSRLGETGRQRPPTPDVSVPPARTSTSGEPSVEPPREPLSLARSAWDDLLTNDPWFTHEGERSEGWG